MRAVLCRRLHALDPKASPSQLRATRRRLSKPRPAKVAPRLTRRERKLDAAKAYVRGLIRDKAKKLTVQQALEVVNRLRGGTAIYG